MNKPITIYQTFKILNKHLALSNQELKRLSITLHQYDIEILKRLDSAIIDLIELLKP